MLGPVMPISLRTEPVRWAFGTRPAGRTSRYFYLLEELSRPESG